MTEFLTRQEATLYREAAARDTFALRNYGRYWSVTDISYVQNRTPKRIVIMLAVIWMTSLLISLAPFAGWKDEGFKDRVLRQHVCLMSQQISYQRSIMDTKGLWIQRKERECQMYCDIPGNSRRKHVADKAGDL
ncbi:hypothetical protein ANCDUO_01873 [Ancylostoma duodenale]|uniref:Uncharacterized protein n=1 Tax=Ancylostoma duodenale TaxID=51022 RepID=A0A0C2DXU4_9BILA|nr:hypothetical protein ANCDUO_01873 [Ancylostoma duodenale]